MKATTLMHSFRCLTAATLIGVAATACASGGSTFGDEIASVSEDWEAAEKKVERGEKLLDDGRDQVRKGEKQQKDGISNGRASTQTLADAQRDYDVFLLTVGNAVNADEAKAEAKQLGAYRKSVERAEDNLKNARALEKKGRNNLSDGRAKTRKAETMIREGRTELEVIEAAYGRLSDKRPGSL